MNNPTVAVITATIGRAQLARAIESVAAQTYPCTHYVFVDGEQYAQAAHAILARYPQVKVIALPMNTGANGWFNSHINAAAAFLVPDDVICFLDDDNWYRADHVASVAETFMHNPSLDYVHSLRHLYNSDGEFICRDDVESLGQWRCLFADKRVAIPITILGETVKPLSPALFYPHLIDVNCYALTRQTAREVANAWCIKGLGNDHEVYLALQQLGKTAQCTGKYTVNYVYDYARRTGTIFANVARLVGKTQAKIITEHYIQALHQTHRQLYGGTPWAKE